MDDTPKIYNIVTKQLHSLIECLLVSVLDGSDLLGSVLYVGLAQCVL